MRGAATAKSLPGRGGTYTTKALSFYLPVTWQCAPLATLQKSEDKGTQGIEVKEVRLLDTNLSQKRMKRVYGGANGEFSASPHIRYLLFAQYPFI